MNTPPKMEVIEQLMHSDLELLCHGKYALNLKFENGNFLNIEAPFKFDKKESIDDSPVCSFPLSISRLSRAIGSKIVEIKCDTDGSLGMIFSNGDALEVYANDKKYEAYSISINGKIYVL